MKYLLIGSLSLPAPASLHRCKDARAMARLIRNPSKQQSLGSGVVGCSTRMEQVES